MLKLFKKKQKPEEPKKEKFTYTIFMRNGGCFKCNGWAVEKNKLALILSDSMENFENYFYTLEDGGKMLLWAREIEFIKID